MILPTSAKNKTFQSCFTYSQKLWIRFCSATRLGSVAGPVIQATGRSEFEDEYRSAEVQKCRTWVLQRKFRTTYSNIAIFRCSGSEFIMCGEVWGWAVWGHSLRSTFPRLHLLRLWTPTILILRF
jgi:hypothetical protein